MLLFRDCRNESIENFNLGKCGKSEGKLGLNAIKYYCLTVADFMKPVCNSLVNLLLVFPLDPTTDLVSIFITLVSSFILQIYQSFAATEMAYLTFLTNIQNPRIQKTSLVRQTTFL